VNGNLIRFAYLPDVTLGWLYIAGLKLAILEEGWRPDPDGPGGQRREGSLIESCIPDGTYDLVTVVTPRHPDGVFCLSNPALGVWLPGKRPSGQKFGRDAVELHVGNSVDDIEGCLLAGRRHAMDGEKNRHVVLDSRSAIAALRDLLGRIPHTIRIRPCAGTNEVL
jgi:hypothetical protein